MGEETVRRRSAAAGRTSGSRASGGSGRWLTGMALAVPAIIDLAYGREASLVVALVFGPFVASALLSPRETAITGVVALGLATLLGIPDGTIGTSPQIIRLVAILAGAGLAVWLATERVRREKKLRAVALVAKTAQETILRPVPDRLGDLRLASRYVSASAEAQVGGDFYEALQTPWGVRMVVGDVRGKGLDAVRLAALLLGEFRSRARCEPDFDKVVAAVEDCGSDAVANWGEDFATAVFVQFCEGELTAVRCGHPEPLLAHDGQTSQPRLSGTLPLCLGSDGTIQTTISLAPGDRLLVYSDGALEARDASGREFALGESFRRAAGQRSLDDVLDHLHGDLQEHAGTSIGDDVVLFLIEHDPSRRRDQAERASRVPSVPVVAERRSDRSTFG